MKDKQPSGPRFPPPVHRRFHVQGARVRGQAVENASSVVIHRRRRRNCWGVCPRTFRRYVDRRGEAGLVSKGNARGRLRWRRERAPIPRPLGALVRDGAGAAAAKAGARGDRGDGGGERPPAGVVLAADEQALRGGGARVDARDHELRHRADGAELLCRSPVAGIGHVVDLHQFARLARPAALPPASSASTCSASSAISTGDCRGDGSAGVAAFNLCRGAAGAGVGVRRCVVAKSGLREVPHSSSWACVP